jgi:serine protease AprX
MATDKMTPRARSVLDESRQHGEQIHIIVKFHSPSSRQAFRNRAGGLSVRSRPKDFHLIPATAMTVPAEEMERLAAMDEVAEVSYDEPVHVLLDTSVPVIRASEVWETLTEGRGVTLCTLDTGIDSTHPDFSGRIALTADFTGLGSADDGHGHGTHVASIAAGSGQSSNGRYRGVAPQATILAAKVLDNRGDGRMSSVMAGIEWAVGNGAQILILSMGTDSLSDGNDALCDMIDTVTEMGRIVVVAAGNEGPQQGTIGSPAAANGALTVGATLDGGAVADFSSRGPTLDGRVKPEVVAPGASIIAARASGTSLGTPINEYYTRSEGTSMAVPHVAGVCALILAVNPSLKPDDVKWILMDTAVDLGANQNAQGIGRVDALAAVRAAQAVLSSGPESRSAPPPVVPRPDAQPEPDVETTVSHSESAHSESSHSESSHSGSSQKTAPGCLGALLNLLGII